MGDVIKGLISAVILGFDGFAMNLCNGRSVNKLLDEPCEFPLEWGHNFFESMFFRSSY